MLNGFYLIWSFLLSVFGEKTNLWTLLDVGVIYFFKSAKNCVSFDTLCKQYFKFVFYSYKR
jgi:hypothetical protein